MAIFGSIKMYRKFYQRVYGMDSIELYFEYIIIYIFIFI